MRTRQEAKSAAVGLQCLIDGKLHRKISHLFPVFLIYVVTKNTFCINHAINKKLKRQKKNPLARQTDLKQLMFRKKCLLRLFLQTDLSEALIEVFTGGDVGICFRMLFIYTDLQATQIHLAFRMQKEGN